MVPSLLVHSGHLRRLRLTSSSETWSGETVAVTSGSCLVLMRQPEAMIPDDTGACANLSASSSLPCRRRPLCSAVEAHVSTSHPVGVRHVQAPRHHSTFHVSRPARAYISRAAAFTNVLQCSRPVGCVMVGIESKSRPYIRCIDCPSETSGVHPSKLPYCTKTLQSLAEV